MKFITFIIMIIFSSLSYAADQWQYINSSPISYDPTAIKQNPTNPQLTDFKILVSYSFQFSEVSISTILIGSIDCEQKQIIYTHNIDTIKKTPYGKIVTKIPRGDLIAPIKADDLIAQNLFPVVCKKPL